jgi:hypothetical protein
MFERRFRLDAGDAFAASGAVRADCFCFTSTTSLSIP